MTIAEAPLMQDASVIEQQKIDVTPYLSSALEGALVTGWDSINMDVSHRDTANQSLGGVLLVAVQTIDANGGKQRFIEIDNYHRPFPEDIIRELGAPAKEKEDAIHEQTILVGDQKGAKLSRIICSNNFERCYVR